jgi:hypothetical protein
VRIPSYGEALLHVKQVMQANNVGKRTCPLSQFLPMPSSENTEEPSNALVYKWELDIRENVEMQIPTAVSHRLMPSAGTEAVLIRSHPQGDQLKENTRDESIILG